jgi:hypothetical protein
LTNNWSHDNSEIPNIIWTFWDGERPPLVQRCIQSWKHHNSYYKIVILNKQNVLDYVPEIEPIMDHPIANDTIQRLADYIRLYVLAKYGGFWFDTSIICQTSNTWIHDIQNKTGVEFIGYYNNTKTLPEYKNTIPVIENWCFACIPGSRFVNEWLNEFLVLLDHSKPINYVNRLFDQGLPRQNNDQYEYLSAYLACQKVLFDNMNNRNNRYMDSIYLQSADNTALIHYTEDGTLTWNTEKACDKIINKTHSDQPLLKLIKSTRDDIINRCANQGIDIETLFT